MRSTVTTHYEYRLMRVDSESEIARLAAEVRQAIRQTGRISQAVTRIAAEAGLLAGEVGALAAESGQEFLPESAPAPRSAPDDEPSP